jgi:hypothetical protein
VEEIPVNYGGFKRENDFEFSDKDGTVSELILKAGSTHIIEIPALEVPNSSLILILIHLYVSWDWFGFVISKLAI